MAHCPKCGASVDAGITHCPRCIDTEVVDTPIQYPTGGMIAWSIITLLLCTIPGIVALVQTSGVNKCATHTEQEKKYASARTWNIIGTVLGVLSLIGSLAGNGMI